MSSVQEKLEALKNIGADKLIDKALTKVVRAEIARIKKEQRRLSSLLKRFEKKYKMASAECEQRFEAGQLGDNADFFEWTGIYKIYQANETALCSLREKLK